MSDANYNVLQRLDVLESVLSTIPTHTAPSVSPAELKAVRAEIESLRAALADTRSAITATAARQLTQKDLINNGNQLLREIAPMVGDALLAERKRYKGDLDRTLGSVHAEVQATRNAASAQAQHSADFLRAAASHFARG